VLDARAQFTDSSLADLYDPLTMPPVLVKAHQEPDKAVDLCYRTQSFVSEANRIEFLFELYDKYVNPLIAGNEKRAKFNPRLKPGAIKNKNKKQLLQRLQPLINIFNRTRLI
jgi:hypothetical protein